MIRPLGYTPGRDRHAVGRPQESLVTRPSRTIDELLESTDLSDLATDPTISEFWKGQIAKARTRAEAGHRDRPLRLANVIACLGYGFRRLPPGGDVRDDPELVGVLDTWQSHTRPLLKKAGPRGCGLPAEQWEHLCAVAYLSLQGTLEAYLDFIRPLGIRSDMSTARHYYYATVIRHLWEAHLSPGPLHVLEVGAGAANLAVFLTSLGIVRSYVIVDLPEMLLNAALQLREFCREAEIRFDEVPGPADSGGPIRIYLVKTLDASRIPEDRFTLALNFNSFMEMDRRSRDFYIEQIYRTAVDGAVFYNVNRRQAALPQPDGSTFDNNPLLYPYRPTDEVLFWEDDPFQTASRGWFGFRTSLAIARACRVRKP